MTNKIYHAHYETFYSLLSLFACALLCVSVSCRLEVQYEEEMKHNTGNDQCISKHYTLRQKLHAEDSNFYQ
jgi:hypothetical protein